MTVIVMSSVFQPRFCSQRQVSSPVGVLVLWERGGRILRVALILNADPKRHNQAAMNNQSFAKDTRWSATAWSNLHPH